MLGPTLETDRLILRPPIAEDLDGWEAFVADPETMQFLGEVQSRAGAWRGLAGVAGSWALHDFGMFAVIEKASGRWIGRIGPWRPEGWPGTEIGWGLLSSATGQGYAAEGARATMDWAVDTLGWTDLIHTIHPDNAASIALALRLGSVNRGPGRLPAPLEQRRVDVWGQTAAEWRARRQTRGRVPNLSRQAGDASAKGSAVAS